MSIDVIIKCFQVFCTVKLTPANDEVALYPGPSNSETIEKKPVTIRGYRSREQIEVRTADLK